MPSHQDDMQYAELTEIIVKFTKGVAPWDVAENMTVQMKVSPDVAKFFLSTLKKNDVLAKIESKDDKFKLRITIFCRCAREFLKLSQNLNWDTVMELEKKVIKILRPKKELMNSLTGPMKTLIFEH